ncbi:MAG: hypothetical protein M0Z82_11920 [Actinomycetota bacterium]|nr:hypothetical protein [Actinomycetota bacterium]
MTSASDMPEAAVPPGRPLWVVDGSLPGDIGGRWRSPAGGVAPGGSGLVALARQVGAYRWVEHRLFEVLGGWSAFEAQPGPATLFSVLSIQHATHAEQFAARLPVLAGIDAAALGAPSPGWSNLLDQLATTVEPGASAAGSSPGDPRVPAAGGRSGTGGSAPGSRPGDPGAPPGSGALPETQQRRLDGAGDTPSAAELWATVARLVGLGRVVLPRLATEYARRLWWCTPSEAPLVPVLRGVLADTRHAWLTVEAMVQDYLAARDVLAYGSGQPPGTHDPATHDPASHDPTDLALGAAITSRAARHQQALEALLVRSGAGVPPLGTGRAGEAC